MAKVRKDEGLAAEFEYDVFGFVRAGRATGQGPSDLAGAGRLAKWEARQRGRQVKWRAMLDAWGTFSGTAQERVGGGRGRVDQWLMQQQRRGRPKKLTSRARKGIPGELRAEAWARMMGAPVSRSERPAQMARCLEGCISLPIALARVVASYACSSPWQEAQRVLALADRRRALSRASGDAGVEPLEPAVERALASVVANEACMRKDVPRVFPRHVAFSQQSGRQALVRLTRHVLHCGGSLEVNVQISPLLSMSGLMLVCVQARQLRRLRRPADYKAPTEEEFSLAFDLSCALTRRFYQLAPLRPLHLLTAPCCSKLNFVASG